VEIAIQCLLVQLAGNVASALYRNKPRPGFAAETRGQK